MDKRYKKIFEGTIGDYIRKMKTESSSEKRELPKIKKANTFGKMFATAKKTGAKTFTWKNPITKVTRTYNTELDKKE